MPNSVHGFLGFNWRCLIGEVRWESLQEGPRCHSREDFFWWGRGVGKEGDFFFLNLRQKSLLYGNIIPNNSFFEIINLKIFVDSCGISASLLLRLNASDICSSNKAAAALHPASCFLSLSSGWLIHVLLTMCATESKSATQIWA